VQIGADFQTYFTLNHSLGIGVTVMPFHLIHRQLKVRSIKRENARTETIT
jgi:hypothetical protein